MNAQAPDLCLVVGRNVSGGSLASQLAASLDNRVLWLQTEKDRIQQRDPLVADHWVLLKRDESSTAQTALLSKKQGFSLEKIPFFFAKCRRFYLADLEVRRDPLLKKIHPAILARIQAVSLWNDFSPYLWTKGPNGYYLPNTQWITEAPKTARLAHGTTYAIFHRKALLDEFVTECQAAGAQCEMLEKGALGVQVQGQEGHRVVFNAPHEPQLVSKILWMSRGDSLQQEHSTKGRLPAVKQSLSNTPVQRQIGRWNTFQCRLPLSLVAGLPLFSVWVDSGPRGQGLMKSGRLSSNSIRRVFVVPEPSDSNGSQAHMILQELSVDESFDESFQEESTSRKDSFLWLTCPLLATQNIEWTTLPVTDEDILYLDPMAGWDELAAGCWIVPSKPTFQVKEFEKMLSQTWKMKAPKSTL